MFSQKYSEFDVKAAYVYNFAKFIDWPQNYFTEKDIIIIGVYKNQPFGEALERILADQKIKDKYWEIKFMNTLDDVTPCDIIFINTSSTQETILLLKKIDKNSTLTIGNNVPNFCQYGGIINFTTKNEAKRFEINNNSAIKHNLKISSKLLTLARIITDEFKH